MANPTITIIDTGTTKAEGQGGIDIITGTPTPASFVEAVVTGSNQLAVTITGTWTGELQFESTSDGGDTYNPVNALIKGVDTIVERVKSNGTFYVNGAANQKFRVRAVAAITGAAAVEIIGTTTQNFQSVVPVTNSDALLQTITAGAAATYVSDDQVNESGRGVVAFFDMTAEATASVVVTIQGKDPSSGKYYDLLSSTAITAVGVQKLVVYPGVTVAANAALSHPLPKVWRTKVVVSDDSGTAAITATVGASVIA